MSKDKTSKENLNSVLRKTDVRRMIKEYAGAEYCFLSDYVNYPLPKGIGVLRYHYKCFF